MQSEMLAYSRSHGLFAGIDLSGGVLRPVKDANLHAYGPGVTPQQILDGSVHVTTPSGAQAFLTSLARNVRATTGRK